MDYNDFLQLITRNTINKLDDYRELCLICLENHTDGVDISENSGSSPRRREAIRNNYSSITKQHLPTSDEYPKYVCSTCEKNLSQLTRFAQQIEENAGNWEIFLSSRRADIVDVIKIEVCEEKFDNDSLQDANIYYSLGLPELPPLKIEEIFVAPLNDVPATAKPRKRTNKKTKSPFVTFEHTCQYCDEPTFPSLTQLYSHQKVMHPGVKAFSCDDCGNGFSTKDALVRHMKERHANSGRSHQCQFCAKLFFSDRELKGHEKYHLNERSYVCSLCGKGFNLKTELNNHLKSKVHNVNYKPKKAKHPSKVYPCIHCLPVTKFASVEERATHRNMVHKIYECDVCKNSFLSIESLNSHKLLHPNKPRPHVCSVCNATFNQASHLSLHIECKHSESKAFPCSFCGKMFSGNFSLTSHVNLVHRKQERAKCNECDADFSSNKYLQRHIVERHNITKPSPHDCKDCGKKNSSGQKLALHRLKFHKYNSKPQTENFNFPG